MTGNRLNCVNSKIGLLIASLLIVALSGCNTATTPPSSLNPGSLSADFPNGAEFIASNATVSNQSGSFIVAARQDISPGTGNEIDLSIPENPNQTVPYTVTETDGADLIFFDNSTGLQYEANNAQGFCTITVTEVTGSDIKGTFSGRVVCTTIANSVIDLSNGIFYATY